MAAVQLLLTVAPHTNHQLFSDHYLNEILPKRVEWQGLVSEATRALAEIAAVLERFTPSEIEAQTEEDLVRPILKLLGHTFEVQPALATPDGTKKPDYVLYRDEAAVKANKGRTLDEDAVRTTAFAVADAKYWNRPLDVALKHQKGDPFNNRNPSFQIAFYMQHSGLPWGILTNGRRWRLYHQSTAHKLDRFYEVDLAALIRAGDPARFLSFYAFFRREAFEPGPIGVDEVLQQSIDYALKVGGQLKRQVFDALRHLAQGFLDYPENQLTANPATLKEIYDNSLILLYRMLFILYAEARELLPVRESPVYRDSYSLRALTREIADADQRGRQLLSMSGTRWPRLRTLFSAIDRGNPPLHVATFNGGLFDPERHPFLEQYVVGDRHLEQAIDTLARVDGQFVDYRDLAEQHLGTIYEGLLEYHLETIDPEEGWQVDLVNDRGERKKIGSYYTPNYIVKYIVDHTVGPVLQAAVDGKSDEEKIEAILRVNVLDPAMGSAYFLVEATEYIARFIVNLAVTQPNGEGSEESDLAYWKRQVVQSCIYGVDINPLAVELAKLSLWLSTVAKDRPLSFLDHHLRTGNSLVGTRITETEEPHRQAAAATKGKRREARATAVGQLSMMADDAFRQSMSRAVDSMWAVERSKSATVEDVKTQERLYRDLHQSLTGKYGRFADLVTASDFGLNIDTSLWPSLSDFALGRAALVPPSFHRWMADAVKTAERERFFHWDLEFPEVFFDQHGGSLGDEAGFHAVVGNPPYVRQERLAVIKPYLRTRYQSFSSVADLYVYFFERGIHLLSSAGRLGFISSGTFARANFAKPFRAFLPIAAQVEQVIDFGENQPFAGAEMVRPTIVVLGKGSQAHGFRSLFMAGKIPTSLNAAMDAEGVHADADVLQQPEWTFQLASTSILSRRLTTVGRPLGKVVKSRVLIGVKTGFNEAFVIDQATRERLLAVDGSADSLIHPLVTGQDLRPWYTEEEGRHLIVIPAGWSKRHLGQGLSEDDAWIRLGERHPSVAQHLQPFAAKARMRGDKGDYWWELRPCDYYGAFETPKILFPDIAKLPRYSLDTSGTYLNNTGYFIPDADAYLLGVLQSRVVWFVTSQISQPLRLRAGLWQYRLFPQFLERLPVPDASPADKDVIAALAISLSDRAKSRYQLHDSVRNRVSTDLSAPGVTLNQKLTKWWTLDFPTFRTEVQKALKRDIPVRERDEWAAWLEDQRGEHDRLTADIVRLETELNAHVYALFSLSPDEIVFIEETTKYQYGAV
jgi:hypothetical protein